MNVELNEQEIYMIRTVLLLYAGSLEAHVFMEGNEDGNEEILKFKRKILEVWGKLNDSAT